jgi:hypothetical protein
MYTSIYPQNSDDKAVEILGRVQELCAKKYGEFSLPRGLACHKYGVALLFHYQDHAQAFGGPAGAGGEEEEDEEEEEEGAGKKAAAAAGKKGGEIAASDDEDEEEDDEEEEAAAGGKGSAGGKKGRQQQQGGEGEDEEEEGEETDLDLAWKCLEVAKIIYRQHK